MKASTREFRHRFWIYTAIFWAAFACYWLDPVNAGQWLLGAAVPALRADPRAERLALQALFGLATALALAGALLRTWATAHLRGTVVHDGALHTERLVTDGPYRHVRNPLYLGTELVTLAMAPMASRLGAVVLLVGGLVFLARLIGREEAALEAAQGDRFRAYRARVPGFLPSLTPRVPSAGGAAQWGEGIVGEGFFWLVVIAMAAFSITLDGRMLMVIGIGGLGLYWALVAVLRRRAAARAASGSDAAARPPSR